MLVQPTEAPWQRLSDGSDEHMVVSDFYSQISIQKRTSRVKSGFSNSRNVCTRSDLSMYKKASYFWTKSRHPHCCGDFFLNFYISCTYRYILVS